MPRLIRVSCFVLGCASFVFAQRLVVFLEDGSRLPVREFEVVDDRVRYFSLDRGQWEEIPVEIVDMERTHTYRRQMQSQAAERREEEQVERIAERRARTELHNVPIGDGVYHVRSGAVEPLEQVFWEAGKSKKRAFLNTIAPVPVQAGKITLATPGLSADTVTTDEKPVFYLRLDTFSRFGIARVLPEEGKDRRVLQEIYLLPRTEEQTEVQGDVEVFRQQLAPLVYKVWPVEPLPAGEYAVVNYTPGETDLRAWAFSHRPETP